MANEQFGAAQEQSQDDLAPYRTLVEAYGILPDALDPVLLERMALLDRETETLADERQAIAYARRIAASTTAERSPNAMPPEHWRTVELATLFTDIGKTGPRTATPEQQDAVTAMYGVDAPWDGTRSVAEYLEHFFPDRRDAMTTALETMDVRTTVSMRTFWNLHAGWTLGLVRDSGLPTEVALTAATHHLLEGVNPDGIVDIEGSFHDPNVQRPVDQREMFVILLDKYDASRRRGKKTHEQAIAYLKDVVSRSSILIEIPRLSTVFRSCVNDLDLALRPDVSDTEMPEAA
ncbi:MAG: hypothetical protein Q7S02_02270 [bacterium]|nr:hypothetical protein [bacterium]